MSSMSQAEKKTKDFLRAEWPKIVGKNVDLNNVLPYISPDLLDFSKKQEIMAETTNAGRMDKLLQVLVKRQDPDCRLIECVLARLCELLPGQHNEWKDTVVFQSYLVVSLKSKSHINARPLPVLPRARYVGFPIFR